MHYLLEYLWRPMNLRPYLLRFTHEKMATERRYKSLQIGKDKIWTQDLKKALNPTLHKCHVPGPESPCTMHPLPLVPPQGLHSYNWLLPVLPHPFLSPCWTTMASIHTYFEKRLLMTYFGKISSLIIYLLPYISTYSPNFSDFPLMFLKKQAMWPAH